MLAAFLSLPIIIEIETARGMVGMVHGDVPQGMSWGEFKQEVSLGNPDVIETALWGRDRITSDNQDGVIGIDRLFVGHTPQWKGVKRFGNVYAIDTGAVFGELGRCDEGHLSMFDACAKTMAILNPILDTNKFAGESCTAEPFGQYCKSKA